MPVTKPDFTHAKLQLSPNHGERKNGANVSMLILHYTAMDDGKKAVEWLCNPQSEVSAHYMVHRDGIVEQMVMESRRAWHAGLSFWRGETDINSKSIGIEICNQGCVNDHFHPYPPEQITSLITLCRDIINRHNILPENILGHSDIAPERKQDPGEHFPWDQLAKAGIGHYVEPEAISGGMYFMQGESGQPVEALQSMLALYGYNVDINGEFDDKTQFAVIAFQRHFRPKKVDGIVDVSTFTTLHRLLKYLPKLYEQNSIE